MADDDEPGRYATGGEVGDNADAACWAALNEHLSDCYWPRSGPTSTRVVLGDGTRRVYSQEGGHG